MEKKTDRRVVKTKRAIRNAFAEALIEKHLNEITIKEIADRADINRKTFYNYYASVHQVLDEVENEIVSAFEADLADFDFRRDVQNPRETFKKLSQIIESDLDFYGALFRAKSNSHLRDKIAHMLRDKTIAFFQQKYPENPETLKIVAEYTLSGVTAVYQQWFESGRQMSMEELSKILSELVANGVKAYLPSKGNIG